MTAGPALLPWTRRVGTVLLALAAIAFVAILHPGGARAAGCENSWTAGKSGSWFTAANWSKGKVPTASEEVCITEAGTYTVEQTQTPETVTVKALTVGGASGTQTLAVGSSCSHHAVLTTTAGLTVGTQGAVTLTNGDGCGNNVTLVGPVSNAGTLTTLAPSGGARRIEGSLNNTGTLQVNVSLAYAGAKTTLTNEGSINVAEGKTMTLSEESSLSNATGGSINGTGSGDVVLINKTSFNEGAGKTTGSLPVILEDAALTYSGSGSGPIAVRGSATVTGKSSSGQTLLVQSSCAKNANVSVESFTNGGALTLNNGDGCSNIVALTVASGTLASSGTITSEPGVGGARSLAGKFTNSGTLQINGNTSLTGPASLLKNQGAVNIANAATFSVTGATGVENESGTITGTGTGALVQSGGGTFVEGGGAISGTQPVVVEDGTLSYTGSGAGLIALRGNSALAGGLASGQSLAVQSTCAKHNTTAIAASLTNAGTITLGNGDGCSDNVTLTITSPAVLTNSGTLSSEKGVGGSRSLIGKITNTGSLNVNANTSLAGTGSLLKNQGALNLANGVTLGLSGSAGAENASGTITGTGSGALVEQGGVFTEGGGKISGSEPVIVEDAALTYSGSGSGPIALRGTSTVAGNTSAGQTLALQSSCAKHNSTTIASSLTNAGAITLGNGDACSNNVALAITSPAVLTNSGSITIEKNNGGARSISGSLTNTGTVTVGANTSYSGEGVLLLSGGTLNLAEGVTLTVSSPTTVTNEGGAIVATGNGQLVEHGGTFNQGNGKTEGTLPVAVEDATLNYTGKGAGPIALRGTSGFTGAINAGQTLALQSTCAKHTSVSTAALVNSGTIVMTNGDGCGDNVTLTVAGAGTITNKGAFTVERANGGVRVLEGSLANEKTVTVTAGGTLKLTGAYTQTKKGTYNTGVSEAGSGLLAITGSAKVEGTLGVLQGKGFVGKAGQKFSVLTSSALTGTFSKLKGNKIKKSKPPLKYNAVYSGTGVTLEVGP